MLYGIPWWLCTEISQISKSKGFYICTVQYVFKLWPVLFLFCLSHSVHVHDPVWVCVRLCFHVLAYFQVLIIFTFNFSCLCSCYVLVHVHVHVIVHVLLCLFPSVSPPVSILPLSLLLFPSVSHLYLYIWSSVPPCLFPSASFPLSFVLCLFFSSSLFLCLLTSISPLMSLPFTSSHCLSFPSLPR